MSEDMGARLVAAARGYLRVRWHHMGRTREGLDCVGLVLVAFRDVGLPLRDAEAYARGHRGDELLQHVAGQGVRVPLDPDQTGDPAAGTRDGDVLLFAEELYVCHLGIRSTMWGVPAVIHAHAGRRMVREEPLASGMGRKLRAAYRHPALAEG